MSHFEHQRHKPPTTLDRPRGLVLACAPLRSNINLSRILRAAGCCGIERVICTGQAKVIQKVARDGAESVTLEPHRTLKPVLAKLRSEGFRLVGLEQTTGSCSMHAYKFPYKTVLVVGNERTGLTEELLAVLDDVVEIPVWGMPYSYNAATATCMAMYEYCRQFPAG